MISFGETILLIFYTLLIPGSLGTTEVSQEHSRSSVQRTTVDNVVKQTAGHMSCSLHGQLGLGYFIEIFIGDTAQLMNVLIDTGSSNFAVAAVPHPSLDQYFNTSRSHTLQLLQKEIYVSYVEGSWKGIIANDLVLLPSVSNETSFRAVIALVTESSRFFIRGSGWQGILGLAYRSIARPDSSVEPFMESLISSTGFDDIITLQLCGADDSLNQTSYNISGTLTIGSVDRTRYVGDIIYTPLLREWYYEIVITNMSVGGFSPRLDCSEYNNDKTIVDSGTTDLRLPPKVFIAVVELLRQQTTLPFPDGFWSGTDVLCWNRSQTLWYAFPVLTLSLAASADSYIDLVVTPKHYIRRITRNEEEDGAIKVTDYQRCHKLAISQSNTGTVLGTVVMEGFYVVFDRQQKRMGFAQTSCANRVNDYSVPSSVRGPYNLTGIMSKCIHAGSYALQAKDIVSCVIMSVLALCLIFLLVWIAYERLKHLRQRSRTTDDTENLLVDRRQSNVSLS